VSYFAVYRIADRTLLSTGSRLPDTLPDGLASVVVTEEDVRTKVWDAATLTFVPRPPVERTRLTPDEFWDRMTSAELLAVEQQSWAATQAAARLRVAVKILDRAEALDVSLPRIRGAVQVFVDAGILTVRRRNEIFAPVVTP
jgi:hypothetical protein